MKKKILIFILLIFIQKTQYLNAQETIGLLEYNPELIEEGYTLFSPLTNSLVYLIDNCGNIINQWDFNGTPRAIPYLLENGTLLRSGSEGLEIRDWDNSLIWSYDLFAELGLRQHHDIEPMPNGNILAIIREFISVDDQISLGKNPSLIDDRLKSEKIIEFKPIGSNDIQIVWEWRFADHLIQDFDSFKSNFGIVEDHPELIDFNYSDYNMLHSDWIHMNAIDYNSDLDQIVMSSKSLGEIYIIDHSTSTAEAASHSGGNYNMGGDFLWRWGNPEVYRQGTVADRKLFEQHDPKWIPNGYVNAGKISVFNNDVGSTQTHSSINIIAPAPINSSYEIKNNKFSPEDFFWSWNGEVLGETVFQPTRSGVIALPNGNMLFCESSIGRFTEIDSTGEIAWIYRNPSAETIINQFSTENEIVSNSLFRVEKYPINYQAFIGKDLSPTSIIEDVNSNSNTCNENLSATKNEFNNKIRILNNPVKNGVIIFSTNLKSTSITLFNISGQSIIKNISLENSNKIDLPQISKSIYFLHVTDNNSNKTQIIKFVKI